jgi:chromatin remodeling complex protein RSC6
LAAKRKSKSRRKSTSKRKTKSRSKSKSRSKKKPFGGYSISFSGRTETLEQVFGRGNVTPSEMTKKIWKFIKAKRLASK